MVIKCQETFSSRGEICNHGYFNIIPWMSRVLLYYLVCQLWLEWDLGSAWLVAHVFSDRLCMMGKI